MTKNARPEPPGGLAEEGAALWRTTIADLPDGWELTAVELRTLEQACRCADDAAELEAAIAIEGVMTKGSAGQPRAHPALDVLVRLRSLEARLLGSLKMEEQPAPTPAQARSQKASRTRWNKTTTRRMA